MIKRIDRIDSQVISIFYRHKYRLFLLLAVSLATGLTSGWNLLLISKGLQQSEYQNILPALFLLNCVVILLVRHGQRILASQVAIDISNELRLYLFDLIEQANYERFMLRGKSEALTIMVSDVQVLAQFIMSFNTTLSNLTFVLGGMVVVIISVGIEMFTAMIFITSIYCLIQLYFMNQARERFDELREIQCSSVDDFRDISEGIKEVNMNKSIGRAIKETHIRKNNEKFIRLNREVIVRNSIGTSFGQIAIFTLIGILVFISPVYFGLEASYVMGAVLTVLYIANPLEALMASYLTWLKARSSIKSISKLVNTLHIEGESKANAIQDASKLFPVKEIRLIDVVFKCSDSDLLIGPFNMRFDSGKAYFIAGENGVGKSTLLNMICGLYRPTSGIILVNDQEIKDNSLESYRCQFGTLFSDFYLHKSLFDTKLLAALKNHQWIESMGLTTVVYRLSRELEINNVVNLSNLSQGERLRLGIMLTILNEKCVYVFDEPGSALDPQIKKFFYHEMVPSLTAENKIVVVVTHDDNYFSCSDYLYLLTSGKSNVITGSHISHDFSMKFRSILASPTT